MTTPEVTGKVVHDARTRSGRTACGALFVTWRPGPVAFAEETSRQVDCVACLAALVGQKEDS